MQEEYSIYDAKAHLSSLLKRVREGSTFVITLRGEPVAELRPVTTPDAGAQTLAERLAELRASGEIVESGRPHNLPPTLPEAQDVPGALDRFLRDRE